MENKIEKLENLGFTLNESKVFLSLMSGNLMTAAEIAKSAGIPRTSVYEILKSFTEKGICNEIETPTKNKYEIIDPDIVKDKIERDIKRSNKVRLESLENTFSEFKALYKSESDKDNAPDIEIIRGFNKHREMKFMDLIKKSNKEILLTNKLRGRIYREQNEEVLKFFKRGGVIRTIYEVTTDFKIKIDDNWVDVTGEQLVELCEGFEKDGAQIRLSDSPLQNFTIFDGETVFVNLVKETNGKYESSDIITRNQSFAQMMKFTFENYWNQSKTIKEYKKTLA